MEARPKNWNGEISSGSARAVSPPVCCPPAGATWRRIRRRKHFRRRLRSRRSKCPPPRRPRSPPGRRAAARPHRYRGCPIVSMGVMNADNPNLVRAALDGGIFLLDTAHGYQEGRNEEMLGTVLKDRQARRFVLCTKVFLSTRRPEDRGCSRRRSRR